MNILQKKFWNYLSNKADDLGHQPAELLDNEEDRLKDLDSIGIVGRNIQKDQRFSGLPKLASYLTGCPQVWINIIDKDTQYCKVDYGKNSVLSYMSREMPRGITTCQFVINNNCEPLVIEDCSRDERTKHVVESSGGAVPKFYAGSPIVSKNGFILGSFCVMDEEPRTITHEQLDGLRILADQFVELMDTRPSSQSADQKNPALDVTGDYYSSATILFIDFVGFTKKTEQLQPGELLEILASYFKGFDQIISRFNLKKVKTIGDAYMAVGGVPDKSSNHATDACQAAIELIKFVNGMSVQQEALGNEGWTIRIGVNTGSVIAGNTGDNFDIWGDSVNLASRLESASEPGRIHISEKTVQFLPETAIVKVREKVTLKDKGEMDTYFLESI